jgi:N-dimethylarginine dimethylaminohydrolase
MEITSPNGYVMSEVSELTRVAVKHVRDAFVDDATIDAQWQALNFTGRPDLARAVDEHERFIEILRSAGATVELLPADAATTLDSIYARDASVISPSGIILCTMGKALRQAEPAAHERAFEDLGIPIAGRITAPGTLEGGDLIWLDDRTVAVGRGYRTNSEGITQLRDILGQRVDVIEVPLPHWRGDRDVMHLMSLISPVDRDAAVVYSPLMPVPFRQWLLARGIQLIEVPDQEFETMGTNVLALAPRRCVMLRGNPLTRAALERAGVEVIEYDGTEISVKGAGGPTCLTRPIIRRA